MKIKPHILRAALIFAIVSVTAFAARGDSITIPSTSADTEIAEATPTTPNGSDVTMVSGGLGTLAGNVRRRALLQFNLSAIPRVANVTSVTVQVTVVRKPNSGVNSNFQLRRVLRTWVETNATWTWPISAATNWGAAGASDISDVAASSASVLVSNLGTYTFASTSTLVADVQGWVSSPASNNGWLLQSDTEAPFTARHFATRESGANTPVLIIGYSRYCPPITNGNIAILLQPIATGLAAPDYAISPPGDTHRLFVVEQNGLLRIIQDGALLPGSALDIQSRVQPPLVAGNPNDERGFLGLAFHPGFNNTASPGFRTLYTYNSETNPAGILPTYLVPNGVTNNYKNVVNEWKISSADPNVVDPTSRREVISFGKNAGNHNGGTIAFGPDGYLYLGLGDGGNANDVGPSHIEPGGNAQNLGTPLGKMLRFDPLHPSLTPNSPDPLSANGQYRIPVSNPFQGAGQVPEIYAYGLRNPYRFAFDRVTGDLIQADVGQNTIEEIDRIVLGGNYGWAIKEGDFLFNRTNGPLGNAGTVGVAPGNRSPGSPAGLIDPISGDSGILEYDHGEGISITGGFVYRGSAIPELIGKYVFGDLALIPFPVRVNGRLFYADLQTGLINAFLLPQFGTNILPNNLTVHGFGQDEDGELYALVTNTSANGTGGIVYKLVPVRLTVQSVGNQLDISWPAIAAHLEVQTNTLDVGISNNWIPVPDSAGTNHFVVPIDPANPTVFYRLVLP